MKLHELKYMIDRCIESNADSNVMIAIKLPYATVGAIPMTAVQSVQNGFDWEKGNFIIQAAEDLTPTDRNFAAQMTEMQRVVGLLQYENRGLKAEIKKLKGAK